MAYWLEWWADSILVLSFTCCENGGSFLLISQNQKEFLVICELWFCGSTTDCCLNNQ